MPSKKSEKENATRIRKAFNYRLYPTPKQEQTLLFVLRRCRHLYNSALEERKAFYQMRRKSLGYSAQAGELTEIKAALPAYQDIYSQVLQDVLRRLDKAFAAFFRRLKNGEKPGYPRFQGEGRYDKFHLSPIGFCPRWRAWNSERALRHAFAFQDWRPQGALAPPDDRSGEDLHHQA